MSTHCRTRTRPPTRRLVLLTMITLGCAALWSAFAAFASEVGERETGAMDQAVRSWVHAHTTPAGSAVFGVVTWLGATAVLVPVTLLVAWLVARRARRRPALVIALAPLVLGAGITLLKRDFGLARPDSAAASLLGFSFPSGHTSASTAASIFLSWALVREGIAPRILLPAGIVIAFAVGLSRVYLDVHWASDVIGGWVGGAAFGAVTCLLYEWVRRGSAGEEAEVSRPVVREAFRPPT